jgi:hypothetical protein
VEIAVIQRQTGLWKKWKITMRLGIAVSRLRKEENENGKPEKLKANTLQG